MHLHTKYTLKCLTLIRGYFCCKALLEGYVSLNDDFGVQDCCN